MFVNVIIENFEGINNRIELNFISKSRNKDEVKALYKTHDNLYLNKITGIIGANASGKTSIINALCKIGGYIESPLQEKIIEKQIKNIEEFSASDELKNMIAMDVLKSLKAGTKLNVQNVRRKCDNTIIIVEMYIVNKEDDNFTGYYTYELEFNGLDNVILTEMLSFRKNYKEKMKNIISVQRSNESQIGYILKYYKNMEEIDRNNYDYNKYKYCQTFYKHYLRSSKIVGTEGEFNIYESELIKWYQKEPNVIKKLMKILDYNLQDIKILEYDRKIIFIMHDGSKLYFNMLSSGTLRFLTIIKKSIHVNKTGGIFLLDEIEIGIHKELIQIILKLFSNSCSESQIIFSTNLPSIFDFKDNKKNMFRHDSIFFVKKINDDMEIKRLLDIRIDGKRIKSNIIIENLYNEQEISFHPIQDIVDDFLDEVIEKTVQ